MTISIPRIIYYKNLDFELVYKLNYYVFILVAACITIYFNFKIINCEVFYNRIA